MRTRFFSGPSRDVWERQDYDQLREQKASEMSDAYLPSKPPVKHSPFSSNPGVFFARLASSFPLALTDVAAAAPGALAPEAEYAAPGVRST